MSNARQLSHQAFMSSLSPQLLACNAAVQQAQLLSQKRDNDGGLDFKDYGIYFNGKIYPYPATKATFTKKAASIGHDNATKDAPGPSTRKNPAQDAGPSTARTPPNVNDKTVAQLLEIKKIIDDQLAKMDM